MTKSIEIQIVLVNHKERTFRHRMVENMPLESCQAIHESFTSFDKDATLVDEAQWFFAEETYKGEGEEDAELQAYFSAALIYEAYARDNSVEHVTFLVEENADKTSTSYLMTASTPEKVEQARTFPEAYYAHLQMGGEANPIVH